MIQGRKRDADPRRAPAMSKLEGAAWGRGKAVLARPESAPVARGGVRVRRQKLFILLSVQLAFFLGSWLAAARVTSVLFAAEDPLSIPLIVPLALLFVSYFLSLWRSVYSRDYHYYLRRLHGAMLKNSPLPLALACLGFLLLGTWRTEPILFTLIFLAGGVTSFILADGCQRLWIRYLSHLGYFRKRVLVVGSPGAGLSARKGAQRFGTTRIFAGAVYPSDDLWLWKPAGSQAARIVKGIREIRTIILTESIGDILLFRDGAAHAGLEREIVDLSRSLSITCAIVPAEAQTQETRISRLVFPNIAASERFAGPRDSLTSVSAKRLLDLVTSLVCLALFLPLGALIALAILILDGPPVFYVSTRVGRNGKPIRFFKFRTMIRQAEKEKAKLLSFNIRKDGPLFKMKNDPRVTRVGRFLRKYSLDEFPQFLNVLAGTMSLVGPRPHLPQEVAQYREGDYLRLECMPGIVGLPQVSERISTMGFREWVDLDLAYRRTWSSRLDLEIIAKTISIFFRGLLSNRSPDYY